MAKENTMALSTQSANLVRQKTYMINRNPGVFYALKALFLHLAANKGNPDLQLVNIDGTYLASDGGNNATQVVADAACTVYAIYLKKSGSTAAWFKATDHASTASTDGTETISLGLTTASGEQLHLYPTGKAFANGVSLAENTTATGSTKTLKANRVDGFIILGA